MNCRIIQSSGLAVPGNVSAALRDQPHFLPLPATVNYPILSLDPSSTRTGWAVLGKDEQLIEAGHLTPDDRDADAVGRITSMISDLQQLLVEVQPGTILIEWPSGHTGARHKGAGSGLAIYGCAVGALWRTCEAWADEVEKFSGARPSVVRVPESWTRRQRKSTRAAVLAALFSGYQQRADRGLDAADAVEMALWWVEEERVRAATRRASNGRSGHGSLPQRSR